MRSEKPVLKQWKTKQSAVARSCSWKFREILKNASFKENLRTTASGKNPGEDLAF